MQYNKVLINNLIVNKAVSVEISILFLSLIFTDWRIYLEFFVVCETPQAHNILLIYKSRKQTVNKTAQKLPTKTFFSLELLYQIAARNNLNLMQFNAHRYMLVLFPLG